jgi:hypothetical protein
VGKQNCQGFVVWEFMCVCASLRLTVLAVQCMRMCACESVYTLMERCGCRTRHGQGQ